MAPEYRAQSKRIVLTLFVCMALVIGSWSSKRFDYHRGSKSPIAGLETSSSPTISMFPCIDSLAAMNQPKRVALLHGPDWVMESTVAPSCLPEREILFITEVDGQFLHHSARVETKLWVAMIGEIIHVRIVESSGDEKQALIAVDLVTNHKCNGRTSKNCIIQGGATVMTM